MSKGPKFFVHLWPPNLLSRPCSSAGAFRRIDIGLELEVSHFLYEDDVILLYCWELENAIKILRILKVFQMASGLKINLPKSK